MTIDSSAPRSRRAILAAAAGSVAAVAASAALPLGVAASPANLMSETDNLTSANTAITNNGSGAALTGSSIGSGGDYGLEGTSATGAGVVGWSVDQPTSWWPTFDQSDTKWTGVFGTAPESTDDDFQASGVWGDSPEIGVFGSGTWGVVGLGGIGVEGDANSQPGSVGVWAWAPTNAQTALKVTGKVSFSRSGRTNIATGKSSIVISLAGVASNSRVFAVLASNRSGRYVRAVVPTTNSFTIYLNTTVTSTTVVTWFVLDY
jgi:hypothetical protein